MILLNHSSIKMPRKYMTQSIEFFYKFLKKNKINADSSELVVVFLNTAEAKKINKKFRGKDYATDVLSFEPSELVLCPQVIARQAQEHSLSFRDEATYMVFHGVLHLLGFDHEKSEGQAKKMFILQDRAFERWMSTTKKL